MSEPGGAPARLATSRDDGTWDNEDLLRELREADMVPQGGHWAIWSWEQPAHLPARLQISIAVPRDVRSGSATHEFLDGVGRQLKRSFGLFCSERGWPAPSYELRSLPSSDGDWSYHISLPGGPEARGSLRPAKILAMGDEAQLAPLLGLETLDPMMGLPAKWIARSQAPAAHSAELHLFDGPGLVAAHTLHLVAEIWQRCLGFVEVQRWLLHALPSHAPLLATLLPERAAGLLAAVKTLVADGLWLPDPCSFLESYSAALPELEAEKGDHIMLQELLRRDVVPLNLTRFSDREGMLHAVEWRGEVEEEEEEEGTGLATRLINRLGAALLDSHDHHGPPIVLTSFENRLALSQALRGPFPHLPVLSWAELPAHARVNIVAVVDARFEVDPSPWAYASFEVGMP